VRVDIVRATEIDDDIVTAFAQLVPQLSATARPPTRDSLAALVGSPDATLLLARDPGIVGTATLTLYRIPTGTNARIDDVIVDLASRRRGIGEALTVEAIRIARAANARSISLTSRPDREAANRLYRRLGFVPIETNVYRFPL
jgi:ribosomal protein S18 acetylase RimI-like enzyme